MQTSLVCLGESTSALLVEICGVGLNLYWPVGPVGKLIAMGSIPWQIESVSVACDSPPQRRFCVAQALMASPLVTRLGVIPRV